MVGIAVGPCPSVVATLTSATGTLSADGLSLTVDALGSGTGCFGAAYLVMPTCDSIQASSKAWSRRAS